MKAIDRSLYERDGFLVVRGLFAPEKVGQWKEKIVALMAEQGELDTPSGVKVWMADELDPYFGQVLTGERIGAVLRELVGPHVEFLSVKPVFKNASTTFASPWHQDWFYWRGSTKISVWIALDAADQSNGCLKMIPGSHRDAMAFEMVREDIGFKRRIAEEDLEGLPVADLVVEPGDAVFFHDLAIHASHPNSSGRDRWSFIATYRDSSVEDAATIWESAIPLPS